VIEKCHEQNHRERVVAGLSAHLDSVLTYIFIAPDWGYLITTTSLFSLSNNSPRFLPTVYRIGCGYNLARTQLFPVTANPAKDLLTEGMAIWQDHNQTGSI